MELPAGDLNARSIWAALSNKLPVGSVISEEAGVTSLGADDAMRYANQHDWLNLTGGAIGQAIPVATGAAVHAKKVKVVAMQGDGGAMYTIQSLWTQARERLPVVNVILVNDRYAILDYEIKNHGLPKLSDKGSQMFSLADPRIDWSSLGQSLGVPTLRATTAETFAQCLDTALAADGPYLIEARLSTNRKKPNT
jgi:acetolactate synthase-1/2/3 large subunit